MGDVSPFEQAVRWLFSGDTLALIIPGIFVVGMLAYLAGIIWQGWDANRANQPIYAAAEARRIARAAARRNNREGEA